MSHLDKKSRNPIQDSLRVPIVNKIFRTLANYSDYLEQAWHQLRPVLRSAAFEQAAEELRALAVLETAPAQPVLSLDNVEDSDRLTAFNDTIHYVLPKLLLIATALHRASFIDAQQPQATEPVPALPVQPGIINGTVKVQMVNPNAVQGEVKQIFEDVKQRHNHSLVSSYYRGLAQWPEVLGRIWGQLRPYVGTDQYVAQRDKLVAAA